MKISNNKYFFFNLDDEIKSEPMDYLNQGINSHHNTATPLNHPSYIGNIHIICPYRPLRGIFSVNWLVGRGDISLRGSSAVSEILR